MLKPESLGDPDEVISIRMTRSEAVSAAVALHTSGGYNWERDKEIAQKIIAQVRGEKDSNE